MLEPYGKPIGCCFVIDVSQHCPLEQALTNFSECCLVGAGFLGQDGWPAPQIRELNIRKGSSKWSALYDQVMSSVQKLFQDARLVHGDLSEYNILIAPNSQVDHTSANIGSEDDLQTALIDFGQAVEVRHPKAKELLERDLTRVKEFFTKQGVKTTMSLDDAMALVVGVTLPAELNETLRGDDAFLRALHHASLQDAEAADR